MDQHRGILDMDRSRITFANLIRHKVQCGYSARDFMFYLKRNGNDTAELHPVDHEEDVFTMVQQGIEEKTCRLIVSITDIDYHGEYAVTPLKKRRTHVTDSGEGDEDEQEEGIDAYKVWLSNLEQDKDNPGTNALEKYISMIYIHLSKTVSIYMTCICASCRIYR